MMTLITAVVVLGNISLALIMLDGLIKSRGKENSVTPYLAPIILAVSNVILLTVG